MSNITETNLLHSIKEINTLPKGVVVETNNNALADIIRNINKIEEVSEASYTPVPSLPSFDGYKLVLNDNGNKKIVFFEAVSHNSIIEMAYFDQETPLSNEEMLLVALSHELINNRCTKRNDSGEIVAANLGHRISVLNSIPVITEENVELLNDLIRDIVSFISDEKIAVSCGFEESETPLSDLDVTNSIDLESSSIVNGIELHGFLYGYNVSDEVTSTTNASIETKNEAASAVAEKLDLEELEPTNSIYASDYETESNVVSFPSTSENNTNTISEKTDFKSMISNWNDPSSVELKTLLELYLEKTNTKVYILAKESNVSGTVIDKILKGGDPRPRKKVELATYLVNSLSNLEPSNTLDLDSVSSNETENKVVVPEEPKTVVPSVHSSKTETQQTNAVPVHLIEKTASSQPVQITNVVPSLPSVDPVVEGSILVKVLSSLHALTFAEKKISILNRNKDTISEALSKFENLNSPNKAVITNLDAMISTLVFKKENLEFGLADFLIDNAISICQSWSNSFFEQNPKMAEKLQPIVDNFVDKKEAELSGFQYSIEELKELRPKFFDDVWVHDLLNGLGFKKESIKRIINKRSKKREFLLKNHRNDILMIPADFKYIGDFEDILRGVKYAEKGIHAMFKGDAGSGKTTFVGSLACLFNLPLFTINGNDNSNIDTFLGFRTLQDGEFEDVPGALVRAMKVGGIFYADEANFIKSKIYAYINAPTDARKELYNDLTGEYVIGEDGFVVFSAFNENYIGTSKMNQATIDRSVGMVLTHMSTSQLENFLRRDYDLDITAINKLKTIFTILSETVNREDIALPPEIGSIRIIEQLAIQIEDNDMPLEVALKSIVEKYSSDVSEVLFDVLSSSPDLGIDFSVERVLKN